MSGRKIIEGLQEALEYARGGKPSAEIVNLSEVRPRILAKWEREGKPPLHDQAIPWGCNPGERDDDTITIEVPADCEPARG